MNVMEVMALEWLQVWTLVQAGGPQMRYLIFCEMFSPDLSFLCKIRLMSQSYVGTAGSADQADVK